MSEWSLGSCVPSWTRRFEAVWRRRLRRRKPEVDVDRANEDEPGADFFGEDASIPYEAAPEIWSRLVERFVFNSPLKFFHFVSRKRKNRDVRRDLAPQRLRQSIWALHTMSGRSLGCSTPSLARRFSAVRRRRFRRRESGNGRRRRDRGRTASSPLV